MSSVSHTRNKAKNPPPWLTIVYCGPDHSFLPYSFTETRICTIQAKDPRDAIGKLSLSQESKLVVLSGTHCIFQIIAWLRENWSHCRIAYRPKRKKDYAYINFRKLRHYTSVFHRRTDRHWRGSQQILPLVDYILPASDWEKVSFWDRIAENPNHRTKALPIFPTPEEKIEKKELSEKTCFFLDRTIGNHRLAKHSKKWKLTPLKERHRWKTGENSAFCLFDKDKFDSPDLYAVLESGGRLYVGHDVYQRLPLELKPSCNPIRENLDELQRYLDTHSETWGERGVKVLRKRNERTWHSIANEVNS